MILLVTYDLKGPASNYKRLFEVLQSHEKWSHYLASTWLLKTDKTPDQLIAELNPLVVRGDRVLVIRIDTGVRANGRMPKDAWEWINQVYTEP